MASIEFIQKRIEGKEKEIATLKKKLERIKKAEASNWENNPYWYSERDLKYTERDIELAEKALQDYKDKLDEENRKAESRNIPAIIEFLEMWKARMMDLYLDAFERYVDALQEWYAIDHEFTEWANNPINRRDRDEYNRKWRAHSKEREEFKKEWNYVAQYCDYRWNAEGNKREYTFDQPKFQKVLDQEANAKYDKLVEDVLRIVGTITDASDLKVGAKGELNGIVYGTDGKAKVQTVGAGGYNEHVILDSGRHGQVFHFRTLVNPIK